MKFFKHTILFLLTLTFSTPNFAQHWVELMNSENPNFFEVKKAYDEYYKTYKFQKNGDTQKFKRWLRENEKFVTPSGNIERTSWSKKEENQFLQQKNALKNQKSPTSSWEAIGPFNFDKNAAGLSYAPGITRMNTVEQDPNDSNIIYAGTATTGLWKSTDIGDTWACITLDMLVRDIGAIEIQPGNSNNVLMACELGLMFSGDGGTTWSSSNVSKNFYDGFYGWDIKIDPNSPLTALAATNEALYRSTNGGISWTQISGGEHYELEYHPTNSSIVYTIKRNGDVGEFWKSTDGGLSFTQITSGVPSPNTGAGEHARRSEIAVTPAAPNNVYWLVPGKNVVGADEYGGLYGFYMSNDSGDNFNFTCCGGAVGGPWVETTNPNTMTWAANGVEDGGQYYYDLGLAVSATDPNTIFTAGINIWKSTDGGISFTNNHHWTYGDATAYVHADVHDVKVFGNRIWVVSDGGIFLSTDDGDNFTDKTRGINGTEIWGFGAGFKDGDVMVMGTYHNGTLILDKNVYDDCLHVWGGDQDVGDVSFGEPRTIYADWAGRSKIFVPTTNTVAPTGVNFNRGINGFINIEFDPRSHHHIYTPDANEIWKTTNHAETWTLVNTFGTGGDVEDIEVAFSDPNVMYAVYDPSYWSDAEIHKSVDGGITWTNITPSSTLTGNHHWRGFQITVDDSNPNVIWATIGGNQTDAKVLKSTNGGSSWNDYSGTLPAPSITDIVFQRGTDGGVYAGTDIAVYYRNNAMSDWQLFSNDFPESNVQRLQIFYKNQKLRAATNGRGVWEVDLYENTAPKAQIAADRFEVTCLDNQVQFINHSAMSDNGATWSWQFPGGTPATSTLEDPVVTYSNVGTYDVTLTVTDIYGTHTQTLSNFIEVLDISQNLPLNEDFEGAAVPPTNWNIENPDGGSTWQKINLTMGANCGTTDAMYMNHFSYNNPPTEDYLYSPIFDLSGVNDAELNYNYAYARYGNGYEDGFRVEVSTDCGATWNIEYNETGISLATVADQTSSWQPANCSDWQNVVIDLSGYANQEIMVRFVGVNDWGNNFYLDDVNITGTSTVLACDAVFYEYLNTNSLPNTNAVSDYIRAGNLDGSGGVDVASGQNVLFQAANYVSMEDGFTAVTGCDFLAKIDGCMSNKKEDNDKNETLLIENPTFTLYPNPTNGILIFNYKTTFPENINLSIYNSLGQEIFNRNFTGNNSIEKIDLTNAENGIYFYKIETPTHRESGNLVVGK